MLRLILIRIGWAIPSLLVVTILVFLATQALPGDAALTALGRNATPEAVATLQERFNLDLPAYQQYWIWLTNTVTGDFGYSFTTSSTVAGIIGPRSANTAFLLLVTGVIFVPIAILLGIYMASRRDRPGDHIASTISLVLNSIPEFVVAILLVVLFATNVFPVLPAVSALNPDESIWAQWEMLVLPVVTLGLLVIPYVARTVRACLIDELDSDHVRMARLKGLPSRRIVIRHALPNIAGPTLQVVAQSLAYLAGGIIVLETIFQYPGLGLALTTAVGSRDIPVIQAITVLLAAFYIIVNILADVGTLTLTPTLKRSSKR